MNYEGLHAAAKQSLSDCRDHPTRLTLWYLLLLCGVTAVFEIVQIWLNAALGGMSGLQALDARSRYDLYVAIVAVALPFLTSIWEAGYHWFALKISRGRRVLFSDFAAGFRMFGQFLLLHLLKRIMIAMWSVLFVIPGIVAAYRYRLAEKILLDQPELSPLDAIRESRRLTQGHKLELFLLDLTFWLHYLIIFALESLPEVLAELGYLTAPELEIGCYLACVVVLLLVELHQLPLVQTTYAHAYNWILSRDR